MKKYQYIDLLRGIAITGVVFVHSSLLFYTNTIFFKLALMGILGVQLFFVVSALTLCLSMEERGFAGKGTRDFFIRRYFRIAPLYYLGILLYYILNIASSKYILSENELGNFTPAGVLSNALFVHGFIPRYNNNLVPGGWSIGTEMVFYLFFPFLFRWLREKSHLFIFSLSLSYALVFSCLAFIICWYLEIRYVPLDSFYYYNFLNQLPVFLWGILLYKQVKSGFIRSSATKLLILFIGIAACIFNWMHAWRLSFCLIPFFAGMAFFAFGAIVAKHRPPIRFLSRIGRLSYSIYILHFAIVNFLFRLWLNDYLLSVISNPIVNTMIVFCIALFVTIVLASFTERYIEKPMIRFGNKLIGKGIGNRE